MVRGNRKNFLGGLIYLYTASDKVLKNLTMGYFQDGIIAAGPPDSSPAQTKPNLPKCGIPNWRASKMMEFDIKISSVAQTVTELRLLLGLNFRKQKIDQKSLNSHFDWIFFEWTPQNSVRGHVLDQFDLQKSLDTFGGHVPNSCTIWLEIVRCKINWKHEIILFNTLYSQ